MIDWLTSFLTSDVVMSTPLLLTTLGAVYSERAGILNISNEGLMLTGAFFGAFVSYASGSALLGALGAMLAAMVLNLVFAFFVIRLRANQVVAGLAINILATGLTVTLNRVVFGVSGTVPEIAVFQQLPIPLLRHIPILGKAVFSQNIIVYLTIALVPLLSFVLMRTSFGLKVRSAGENPQACDTLGINVYNIRYLTMVISGLLAGLGGAFLSMGQLSFFTEGMVSGRGYMTLAAVVFGNYTPLGAMGACLLFGAADALKFRLQSVVVWLPYQFWVALPYAITIIAMCAYRRASNRPASHGHPYEKEA